MSLSSGVKSKSKTQTEFLIPAKSRHSFIKHIISDLNENSLDETGTVYKLTAADGKVYSIIVSKHTGTGEIHYYGYDPLHEKLKLGKGAQGEVVIAQDLVSGVLVAVKCQQTFGFIDETERERANLLRVKQLLGTARDENDIEYTVMEYSRGQNLLDELYEKDKSKDRESVEYFSSKKKLSLIEKADLILLALKQIHWLHTEIGLVHRDIKPDNFVLIKRITGNILKFVDWGSAIDPKIKDQKHLSLLKQFVGTFGYAPPELNVEQSKRQPYSFESDIFALGIVLAEILSCHNYQAALRKHKQVQSARDLSEELTLKQIEQMMPDAFKHEAVTIYSPEELKLFEELQALISLCTNLDPNIRLKASNLKEIHNNLLRKVEKLKMSHQTSAQEKLARYRNLKRQNSVLLISDATLEPVKISEISSSTEKSQLESTMVSAKKVKAKSKRDLLKRSVTVSKLKQKVEEKSKKEEDASSLSLETKGDNPLRKRSTSSSVGDDSRSVVTKAHDDSRKFDELSEGLSQFKFDSSKSSIQDTKRQDSELDTQTHPKPSDAIKTSDIAIESVLTVLSQRLSELSFDSSTEDKTSELPMADKMILSAFRQKLAHVRESSGDSSKFRHSVIEFDALADIAPPNSQITDKVEVVKTTCAMLLKDKGL